MNMMKARKEFCNRELLDSGYKSIKITYDASYVDMDDVEEEIEKFIDSCGPREKICMRKMRVISNGILQVTVEVWMSSFGVLVWSDGTRLCPAYLWNIRENREYQYIDMGRRTN